MSDIAWVSLKNMVLIVATVAGIYYISPWMAWMMIFYTMVEKGDSK